MILTFKALLKHHGEHRVEADYVEEIDPDLERIAEALGEHRVEADDVEGDDTDLGSIARRILS